MEEKFVEDNVSLRELKGKIIGLLKKNNVPRKKIQKIRAFDSKHLLREYINITFFNFREQFIENKIPIGFQYSRKKKLSFKSKVIVALFSYDIDIEKIQAIKRLSNTSKIWSYIKNSLIDDLSPVQMEFFRKMYEQQKDKKESKKQSGKNQYAKIIYTPMGNKR